MVVECVGKGIVLSKGGVQRILNALRLSLSKLEKETKEKDFPENILVSGDEREVAWLYSHLQTIADYPFVDVVPSKKNTPLWTAQDEIIERQAQSLRRIAYQVGVVHALLSSAGFEKIGLDATRAIEDECGKGLDARRAVLSQSLPDDSSFDSVASTSISENKTAQDKEPVK